MVELFNFCVGADVRKEESSFINKNNKARTMMHTRCIQYMDMVVVVTKSHVTQADYFNFRLLSPSILNPALCLHHFLRRLVTQHYYYFTLEIFNYSELQPR